MSRTRKLLYTVLLFAAGVGCVAWANASRVAGPLFVAWVPLLTVAWVLTRPEPDMVGPAPEAVGEERVGGEAGSSPEAGTPEGADDWPAMVEGKDEGDPLD